MKSERERNRFYIVYVRKFTRSLRDQIAKARQWETKTKLNIYGNSEVVIQIWKATEGKSVK